MSMNSEIARQGCCPGDAAKGLGSFRHLRFAAAFSQDKWFGQVDGFGHTVMLYALGGLFIEKIEAE